MYVLLDDQATHRQLYFTDPVDLITFRAGESVSHFFDLIEAALAQEYWVAGIFEYEFGAALELKLRSIADPDHVLVRLGVFKPPSDHPPIGCLYRASPPEVKLGPDWTELDYLPRYDKVQNYLRAGDVYQVNLTFPMRGTTTADAHALYAGFRRRQPGRYGGIVSLGGADVISFSPELFFKRRGQEMRMRPMKGTRPKTSDDDMTLDTKSRAENLMIVDLLRNDLSRLCEPGTVKVPELFAIEEYPTLVQMTSQVTGTLKDNVRWEDIFRALFPCGSVTGAPKIRAMEIIHELEAGPRGPYCGAVGYIGPHGDASFSVAIRTATLSNEHIRYDVGSGVVLDSDGSDEYHECLLKAGIWSPDPSSRFETFRTGPEGPVRADRHATRLGTALPVIDSTELPYRVRVDWYDDGTLETVSVPLVNLETPVMIALSRYPLTDVVQRTDVKTSYRDFYDGERARISATINAKEVIFLGEDGLLKEGSFTSLFLEKEGQFWTPKGPGLLPGVLRAEMLDKGLAIEASLAIKDLLAADAIYIGNSLRGLMKAQLVSPDPI